MIFYCFEQKFQKNENSENYAIDILLPAFDRTLTGNRQDSRGRFFEEKNLLKYRSFGYGHSFGILSHYYGRESGLELREDIDTVLEPGMVISMEPMLTIPNSEKGAGGYREHDIIIIQNEGIENITKTPYGPNHNIL